MLEIFNNLAPFIEDCYERYSVRQYAKLMRISPPTASTLLNYLHKENLLKKEAALNHLFFWANREEPVFVELARIYWRKKLESSGLLPYLREQFSQPTIILFGSLARAENKQNADIDLAILAEKKEPNLKLFEKKLTRPIQAFVFPSLITIKDDELKVNILNGHFLQGRWKKEWIG